jgi:hypothetical protein
MARNLRDVWAFASQRPDRAGFICSTGSTTRRWIMPCPSLSPACSIAS